MKKGKPFIKIIGLSATLAFSGLHGLDLKLPSFPSLHLPNSPSLKSPLAKPKPKITDTKKETKLAEKTKGAAPLLIWGAIGVGGAEAAHETGKRLAEYAGPRMDEYVDDELRGGYCESMPQLKGTSGCK